MFSRIDFKTGDKRASELAFAPIAAGTLTGKAKHPFSGGNCSHFEAFGGGLDMTAGLSRVSRQNCSHFQTISPATIPGLRGVGWLGTPGEQVRAYRARLAGAQVLGLFMP